MARKAERYHFNSDIKGIVLVTLGILMIISVFSSASSGLVGRFTKKILIAIMGLGAFIFPVFTIFIGVCCIAKKNRINFNRKFYGIMIFFINTLLFIQMVIMSDYYVGENVLLGIKKLYNADNMMHGGIISYLIDVPLYNLFGTAGCYVIFISIYIISFILICRFSLYDLMHNIKDVLRETRVEKDAIIDEGKLEEDSYLKDGNKKEGFIKNLNEKIKILNFIKPSDKEEKNAVNDEFTRVNYNKEDLKSNKHPIQIECASDKLENKSVDNSINEELREQINKNNVIKNIEYDFPPSELLNQNVQCKLNKEDKRDLINNANKLEETLSSFGVDAKVLQVSKGPSVTRFELQPSPGVKVSKIVNLSDDIALGLAASGVRIEAPIPGKSAVGIEVPNKELTAVYLREVIESKEFTTSKKNLAFCLGKDIGGNCVVSDLTSMPHVLIAGATGSGKSVCINTLIISLLYKYSPENIKLLMIDPKVVELSIYNGIPHLLIPVVTDPKKAAGALNWAVQEMTRRYKLFADNSVRNIEGYNELYEKGRIDSKLPFVVIIIDELADLMMVCPHDVEDYIGRLAQMARAAGMHLVIATQRPSVDVITGVIKANIPSRISFAVSSQIDSRTILDTAGAEKLLGKGDMLFYPTGEAKPIRIQGAFISENEVEKVVDFIKQEQGAPQYRDEIIEQIDTNTSADSSGQEDELLEEAIRIVVDIGQASTSLLQRRLRIGYNRAARIIDQMEEKSVISGRDGSKPRQVLIKREEL